MQFEIMADGLAFPEGPVVCDDGSVILCEIGASQVTRVTPDGRKQVIAKVDGAPNGLAVGPDGALYCCNNGGFDWSTMDKVPLRTRPLPNASPDSKGGFIERIDPATGRSER